MVISLVQQKVNDYYCELMDKVSSYITDKEEIDLIQKAYEYSSQKHLGETRLTGNFGNEDHARARGKPRVQCEPARLVAHDLHEHDAAVAARRRLDAADGVRRDLHRRLEPESDVRAVNIVVDGLWHADDVAALHTQKRGGLVRSRAAQREKAVQPHFFVVGDHSGKARAALLLHRHLFKGLAGRAQNRAACVQNPFKIFLRERIALAADKSAVSLGDADDLGVFDVARQIHSNGADDRVQSRAVPSAR